MGLQGYLLPPYHITYWMGLETKNRGTWSWLEPATPPLNAPNAYQNWATSGARPEPNNLRPPENCGASNLTQLQGGVGGWADANCLASMPFMCMLIRKPYARTPYAV